MPDTYFNCQECGRTNQHDFKYCPYCGSEHFIKDEFIILRIPKEHSVGGARKGDPFYGNKFTGGPLLEASRFQKLLQPIIDLNGYQWIGDRVGVDGNRVARVMKQEFVTTDLVDRWLTRLGLTHAMHDGSIEPPPSQYYEE